MRKWMNIGAIALSLCLSLYLTVVLAGRYVAWKDSSAAPEMQQKPAPFATAPAAHSESEQAARPQAAEDAGEEADSPIWSRVEKVPVVQDGTVVEEWRYAPREQEQKEAIVPTMASGEEIEIPSDYPDSAFEKADGTLYNPVPLFNQLDYSGVPYGDGTVATSGCSMTTIAMVASYLTGKDVRPDDLARRFRTADGSHLQRMEAISIIYDLKYTKTGSFYSVMRALEGGKVVIILLGKESPFTSTQHFLVLTGLTPEGRILVNDALGSNYNKADLAEGFQKGFTQGQLMQGFSGAWIYEFYEPPVLGHTNYPDVVLTQSEKDLLAKLIWREARGESFEGQQAIAEVVLNRMLSPIFPTSTLEGTILAEGQFRTRKFLDKTTADELQYKAIERALTGPNVLPTDVFFFTTYTTNSNVWGRIGKHIFCGAFD